MKWSTTDAARRVAACLFVAISCLGLQAMGMGNEKAGNECPESGFVPAETGNVRAANAWAADSLIEVRVDSATTVLLPDTLVRRLARSLGMVDSVRHDGHVLTRYERNRERAMRGWSRLIPNQEVVQYAGSIGLLNVGFGWHYGRGEHWETELLFGFVPRYHAESFRFTFTAKQRYVPWHCPISRRWVVEPLTAGLFFNTISGDDFWDKQPDRYPKNYYGFSTKIRTHIFLGQRLRYNIPRRKRRRHQAVTLYYELSTCDLYLVSKITNRTYPWSETLSLALGLRFEL